jgi:hypothetical protein
MNRIYPGEPMARRVYKDPFPCAFGNLNITPGADLLTLHWLTQRPFRPQDLLLWGTDSTTYVRSFSVGEGEQAEQIVQPFPFHMVLREPPFGVLDLLGHQSSAVSNFLVDGVMLDRALRVRVNPTLVFKTANVGERLRLVLSGAVRDVLVYGVSVF